MTLHHLLVHLDKSDSSAARADLALSLSARFSARLTALYAVCDPDVPSLASHNRYVFVERAAGKAEAAFRLHASSRAVDAEWVADIGSTDIQVSRAVVMRAREADLIVLGQLDPSDSDGSVPAALIEHTVLHSGRPVLVVPHSGNFADLGRRVVVAWNNSREATRAVHDAMPLLVAAETVTVLSLFAKPLKSDDAHEADCLAEHMARHLIEHGANAAANRLLFDPDAIEPAERLLSYLADTNADLLVIGAPGQRSTRAAKRSLTRRVLAQLAVPVLLSY